MLETTEFQILIADSDLDSVPEFRSWILFLDSVLGFRSWILFLDFVLEFRPLFLCRLLNILDRRLKSVIYRSIQKTQLIRKGLKNEI